MRNKINPKVIIENDFKTAIAGWYVGIMGGIRNTELAWEQPELKKMMEKYKFSREEIIMAIPERWWRNCE